VARWSVDRSQTWALSCPLLAHPNPLLSLCRQGFGCDQSGRWRARVVSYILSLRMLKKLASFLGCALILAASQPAFAVGFGRISHTTSLGQMLDFTVPVSAEAAEQLTSDCVSAEVFLGDNRVPPSAVISRLEWSADSAVRVLRVSTTVRVDEPVVSVTLAAGCPTRLTRQFVLFVDPPAQPSQPLAVTLPGTPAQVLASSRIAQPDVLSPQVPRESRTGFVGDQLSEPAVAPRRPAKRSRAVKSDKAASGVAEVVKLKVSVAGPSTGAKRSSRLRLDPPARSAEIAAAEQAAASAAELAASVASAAALAASEAQAAAQQQRDALQAMQKQMEALKLQAKAADTRMTQMRVSMRESQDRSDLLLLVACVLGAAVVALLACVIWLIRRKVAAGGADSARWWTADPQRSPESIRQGSGAKVSFAASAPPDTVDSLPWSSGAALQDTAVDVLTAMADTRSYEDEADSQPVLAFKPKVVPAGPVPELPWLSADELIDLEQQAEFFVALGQDDSAVSLLEQQLSSAGGGGSWPYLKLLEIYRRLEDRDAYERVREGLDRRFGPCDTAWEDGPTSGRPLDSYPDVTRRIESAWIEPVQAMRLIGSLMVHGEESSGVFDLTAMADLQSLYLLARSSLAPELTAGHTVDFLLPLEPIGPKAVEPPAENQARQAMDSTVDVNLDLLPPTENPSSRG